MQIKYYKTNTFLLRLLLIFVSMQAHSTNFDVGATNWVGTFPGSGTYDQTIGAIQVTGIADRIIEVMADPTAVYSGNDNPAIARNYSYIFPIGSTVSIDFSHLTVEGGSNNPESVGNFSISPSSTIIGNGHSLTGINLELLGSSTATSGTTSTLTWVNISALNFDIANNGNISFVSHKNMRVSIPHAVPIISSLGILLLFIFTLIASAWKLKNNQKRKSNV